MTPRLLTAGPLALFAALAISIPAEGQTVTSSSEIAASTSEVTTVPAPPTPEQAPVTTSTPAAPTEPTSTAPTSTLPASTTSETTTVPAPEVSAQHSQNPTVVAPAPASKKAKAHAKSPAGNEKNAGAGSHKPVSPSALTPPLPSTLGGQLSGVPSFFIDSFSIPPFLLPIYQAAGAAYGIPWQVLAAINEVETDYGRDLNVSSAGAEGWMQFLPSTWGQYGVDVNNDGFEDPNNPADAIFAAARYLKAAGGDTDIRAAILAYNHSQAYLSSVLLRARLLGGTPAELLGAVTGLTEARFPVYAASHYDDTFPATEGSSPHTVPGTTIVSQDGAPVIAVQDGVITQIGDAGPLGRSISLRDAYGNTYVYSELGSTATLYPMLEAIESKSGPNGHALAVASSTNLGSKIARRGPWAPTAAASGATRVFRSGSENVYLHPLRVGAHVIAGTVIGHVGAGVEPHIVFQIRPAGIGTPLVDPKPILDGWVKLQSSSVIKAKGRDPFAKISATPGQTLLESKTQLEQQVPREGSIHLAACERRLIADGRVDRRVLATLAFLSASGLHPSVSSRTCSTSVSARQIGGAAEAGRSASALASASIGDALDISEINGTLVVGPGGEASVATLALRKLAALQGVMKPLQIASSIRLTGAPRTVVLPGYAGVIRISFSPLQGTQAHAADAAASSGLTPAEWLQLVARLGQVPDPTVSAKPSPAAIPDHSGAAPSTSAAEGN
ncbi:MAG: lytic murein transglycosylase [Solirubrobacteraceae bacterium]